MKTLHTNIKIKATTGEKTIAAADALFSYIDADFKKWGTDKKGQSMPEMELAVCEMTKDATFAQLFGNPEGMALSQEQIIEFCTDHKDKLTQAWCTFFLFKVGDDFFVAGVGVSSVGPLDVRVDRFSGDDVWRAEVGRRFVLPQLTLSPSPQSSSTR